MAIRCHSARIAMLLGAALRCAVHAAETGVAEPITLAVTRDSIDWQHCRAFAGERDVGSPPKQALLAALGLGVEGGESGVWSTDRVPEEVRHFRVAFRRPVAIGTICTAPGPGQIGILREDAVYPGDIGDDGQWQARQARVLITASTNTKTRALRFTYYNYPLPWSPNDDPSAFGPVLLLRDRYYTATRLGGQDWSRVGEQDRWLGYWNRPQELVALAVFSHLREEAKLAALSPEVEVHPSLAADENWRPLALPGRRLSGPSVVPFADPVVCRALRLTAPGLVSERESHPRIIPLVKLEANAEPPSLIPPAPVSLQYEMPYDGFVAARISDGKGKHVRRLIAEVERDEGAVQEPWDLKNDAGRYVRPGVYDWTLVARPPLKLTYEITVYNAGHPPWMAPVKGGGWWMADHSPPVAIANVGEVMLMGALGAEFGVPLIATDLDGNKIWHDRHQHVKRLVSDGRYGYIVNDHEVIRVDPQNRFQKVVIHRFLYTDNRPGHYRGYYYQGRSGAAVRDGVLCVSCSAPSPPWIRSAVKSHDIDMKLTFPPPANKKVHDTALTHPERILSAFQTMVSSTQAFFGDAAPKGRMANLLVLRLRKGVPVGSVVVPEGDVQVWALRKGKTLPASFQQSTKGMMQDTAAMLDDEGDDDSLGVAFSDVDERFSEDTWIGLKAPRGKRPGIAVPKTGLYTNTLVFTKKGLQRLSYGLILDRRYRNATFDGRLLALEGQISANGSWKTARPEKNPINRANPAVAGCVWDKPVPLRGLMLTRPMEWAGFAIDVWTGPAEAPIGKDELANDEHWEMVERHKQTRHHMKFNWHTNMTIIHDFGRIRPVRALRVRIVDQPLPPAHPGYYVPRGGFQSLITFQHLGDDPELPETYAERITVLDLPESVAGLKKPKEGWYDPEELTVPVALTLDRNGKVWIVEQHFQPKRISRWSRDGKFEKDFMGPTHYGGGGVMDPGDRTVVNHLGMKFRIDYEQRTWQLESRLLSYGSNYYLPDRVAYVRGHRYLIGDRSSVTSFGDDGPTSGIFVEKEGAAVPIVASGSLNGWAEFHRNQEMRRAWAKLPVDTTAFVWTDRDRDQTAQMAEAQLIQSFEMKHRNDPYIGDDLSLNFRDGYRLRVSEVREDGLPVYDLGKLEGVPEITGETMVTPEGETLVIEHRLLNRDGSVRWRYPDGYRSVQGSMKTPWGFYGRPPGVLSGGFAPLGHFRIAGEQLFCVGGNNGDYYAFTDDGLLAAAILGGPRGYGKRFFSMADCRPGQTHLYLAMQSTDDSPMTNSADDPKLLFQHGDGLDLHLGLDPRADPERTDPAPGDIRVVISEIAEKPVVMLYRYKVKGSAVGGEPATFTSPMGKTEVQEVVQVKEAKIKIVRQNPGGKSAWLVEAAIPWHSLGVDGFEQSMTLRADVGVLLSDSNGVTTVGRIYWANKRHVVMGDLPAEAQVNPSLWGVWKFVVPDLGDMMLKDGLPDDEGEGEEGFDLDAPH